MSDSKILIIGGFNAVKGNNRNVWIIDIYNGAVNLIGKINVDIWSTIAPIYMNNSLFIISTGEEVDDDMPVLFEYPLNLPFN